MIVLFDISLEMYVGSNSEYILIIISVFSVMSGVGDTDDSCFLVNPVSKLADIIVVIICFVFEELVGEEVKGASEDGSGVTETLNSGN